MWAAGSNGDAQLGLSTDLTLKNADFRLVKQLKGEVVWCDCVAATVLGVSMFNTHVPVPRQAMLLP